MGSRMDSSVGRTTQVCDGVPHDWSGVESEGGCDCINDLNLNAEGPAQGVSVAQFSGVSAAPPGAPPPPPPPPIDTGAAPAAPTSGIGAVFAELNKGSEVTKGLRKVDKSEMTHKNPELRASSAVPSSATSPVGKKPVRPSKPAALAGKKPSKMALEGTKWIIVSTPIRMPLDIG